MTKIRLGATKTRRIWLVAVIFLALGALYLWPGAARVVGLYRADSAQQSLQLPVLSPVEKNARVLVLSPHLDDETLGAGGAIAMAIESGARVRVVFCTNGDGSGATILGENFHALRRHSYVEMAQMRQVEAIRALRQLGVKRADIVFLGYPDGGLKAMWEQWPRIFTSKTIGLNFSPYPTSPTPRAPYRGPQMLADIVRELRTFRPTLLLTTHSSDTHVDHWAAYGYALAALQVLATGDDAKNDDTTWARHTQLSGFLIHHGVWPLPHGYHPAARLVPPRAQMQQNTQWRELKLSANVEEHKRRALEEYGSQLLFTPHYLRAFVRRNELFGVASISSTPGNFVLRDESGDVAPRAPKGTDIRALSGRQDDNQWRFQLKLVGAPQPRTLYELQLHWIENGIVSAQRVQVLAGHRNALQVLAAPDNSATARIKGNSIEFSIRTRPRANDKRAALLISASSHEGASLRDQSEIALIHY